MTTPNQPAGRRPSKLAAALQNAVTWVHRVLYRSSNGVIGGRMADSPVLLLTTTGRRSAKQRTVPLLYLMDGPNVVLVASNGGAVRHPTWWLNLQTTSEAWIQPLQWFNDSLYRVLVPINYQEHPALPSTAEFL